MPSPFSIGVARLWGDTAAVVSTNAYGWLVDYRGQPYAFASLAFTVERPPGAPLLQWSSVWSHWVGVTTTTDSAGAFAVTLPAVTRPTRLRYRLRGPGSAVWPFTPSLTDDYRVSDGDTPGSGGGSPTGLAGILFLGPGGTPLGPLSASSGSAAEGPSELTVCVVSGTVRGPDGVALAGQPVTAAPLVRGNELLAAEAGVLVAPQPVRTVSDANGLFRLPLIASSSLLASGVQTLVRVGSREARVTMPAQAGVALASLL